jgi:hypothetical protein
MAGDRRHQSKAGLIRIIRVVSLLFLVQAAVAEVIVVQGQLSDDQGQAWSGLAPIEFSIHDSPANGSQLWAEVQEVEVLDGLFSVTLGVVIPLDDDLFASPDRWLGINVDGAGEQAARFRLSNSPMTIHANAVESLPAASVDGNQLEQGALTPGKLQACDVGQVIVMGADGWICESPGD